MNDKDRIILQKISGYAKEAGDYVQGMTFDAFMQDRKTMSATAFCISQIGELAKEVSEGAQAVNPEIPWRSIKGIPFQSPFRMERSSLQAQW
ncbi:DUF86 domain-containing protein [Pelotomaculum terephthalicicum JT]|uniref:HepT-like ribonuclease domain-containing protein n=1 Tax=Pelotomaculum terephthalicicum TaxID=206393 RepID=UPI001F03D7A1|nr:HepT-like ribonuclease domain-containing protein [Pelotomaculum terephthalicicum]MCG9969685.1 DUF86 domain-containing protein [Pelotomaculum terephthalicicum JT]